jgi:hypothetical protein
MLGHGDDIISLNTCTQMPLKLQHWNFTLYYGSCNVSLFGSTHAVCVMTLLVHLVSSLMECTILKFCFALHSVITVASRAGAFYQPFPGSDVACLGNCCFGLNIGRWPACSFRLHPQWRGQISLQLPHSHRESRRSTDNPSWLCL